jgi:hypothetical protein
MRTIGEMSVAVDQTGENRHFGEVDNLGVGRSGHVVADRLDFSSVDENDLASENSTRVWINQLASADGGDLGNGGDEKSSYCRNHYQEGAQNTDPECLS